MVTLTTCMFLVISELKKRRKLEIFFLMERRNGCLNVVNQGCVKLVRQMIKI